MKRLTDIYTWLWAGAFVAALVPHVYTHELFFASRCLLLVLLMGMMFSIWSQTQSQVLYPQINMRAKKAYEKPFAHRDSHGYIQTIIERHTLRE